MKRNVLEQAADYNKKRRKNVRRLKVLSVLAAVVVFCTTYSLIMPAITMENLTCGLEEHTHGSSCYEEALTCGLEESEGSSHVHDDSCYDVTTSTELTCGQSESAGHTHSDSCYTTETVTKYRTIEVDDYETVTVEEYGEENVYDENGDVSGTKTVVTGSHQETRKVGSHTEQVEDGTEEVRTLSCGQSESAGHSHSDSCYGEVEHKTLTCTEPVGGGHTHSDSCYGQVLTCTIPEHIHTDACKPAQNGEADSSEPTDGDVSNVTDGSQDAEVPGETENGDASEEIEEPVDIADTNTPLIDGLFGDLLDKINNGLTNEEGYLIDAEGNLVLDENGEPIKVQKMAVEAEEIVYTDSNRFYQTVFHVNYNGSLFEDDELEFSGLTTEQEEMESDRDYDYISLIPDSKILPMGRTEFALTLNGEAVDRSEYDVSVEIIPSYESVAYLAMTQGGADTMMLNLTDDEILDAEAALEVIPGFGVYEIIDGELVEVGHMDVDFESIDLDSLMMNAYDEEGNPAYAEDYAVEAYVQGEDFIMTAGVAEDLHQELATSYDQKYYNENIEIWWDAYSGDSQNNYSRVQDSHVASVTLTHSNADKVTDAEAVTINRGNASTPSLTNTTGRKTGEIYDATTKRTDYAVLEIIPEEGYYVKKVLVACAHETKDTIYGVDDCGIWSSGGQFEDTFTVSTGREADTLASSAVFSHGAYNGASTIGYGTLYYKKCFILIQTARIPSPLFVKYDPGTIGNTTVTTTNVAFNEDDWLEGGRTTKSGNNIYHDNRTDEMYRLGDEWLSGDLIYTTAGISDAAKEAALAEGYQFAGWQLEYYDEALIGNTTTTTGHYEVKDMRNEWSYGNYDKCSGGRNHNHNNSGCIQVDGTWYTPSYFGDYQITWVEGGSTTGMAKVEDVIIPPEHFDNVVLSERYASTYGDVGEHTELDLITNAKLTAIWAPNPQIDVTKKVENATGIDLASKTYTFKIYKVETNADGETVETPVSRFTKIESYTDGSNIRYRETNVTGNEFSISVTGNRIGNFKIKGLDENATYKIVESNSQGGRPSYTVNGETGNTFVAKSTSEVAISLTVTNDFSPLPTSFDVTIEKVTPTPGAEIGDNDLPQSAGGDWSALSGATFEIYDATGELVAELSPANGGSGTATATTKLEPGVLYRLHESAAPAGYNQLSEDIYFKVADDGESLVLCTVNGTETAANKDVSNAALTLIVANYGGYVLPSTGGEGTLMYTLGGSVLLMACALTLVYSKTRRKGAREA